MDEKSVRLDCIMRFRHFFFLTMTTAALLGTNFLALLTALTVAFTALDMAADSLRAASSLASTH